MLYILSELHGAKETSQVVREFIETNKIKDVYIEYFSTYQQEISDFVFKKVSLKSKEHLKYAHDGRLNYQLLTTLQSLGLKQAFDNLFLYATSGTTSNTWDEREEGYIENFKQNYRNVNSLLIGGHAHITENLDNNLGAFIKKNYPCEITKIIYKSGYIYNFGKKSVADFENNYQQNQYKTFIVKKATPVNPKDISKLFGI